MAWRRTAVGHVRSRRYLVGAVRVGDPGKRLQGRSDGVGQDEGTRGRTVLLRLMTQSHVSVTIIPSAETPQRRRRRRRPHHVRLQAGHQLPDARLQAVLVPLHLLERRVRQNLRGDTGQFETFWGRGAFEGVGTFWILVFMAEGMVVGETNWKVGAALLGYWAGNFTTR